MSKHTHGPWHVGERDPYFVYAADGHMVADCGRIHIRSIDEMEANARLCATAPEMYEALKMLPLDTLSRTPTPDDYAKLLNAMRAARDVLAKLN
jgi:hypothetical protein